MEGTRHCTSSARPRGIAETQLRPEGCPERHHGQDSAQKGQQNFEESDVRVCVLPLARLTALRTVLPNRSASHLYLFVYYTLRNIRKGRMRKYSI